MVGYWALGALGKNAGRNVNRFLVAMGAVQMVTTMRILFSFQDSYGITSRRGDGCSGVLTGVRLTCRMKINVLQN